MLIYMISSFTGQKINKSKENYSYFVSVYSRYTQTRLRIFNLKIARLKSCLNLEGQARKICQFIGLSRCEKSAKKIAYFLQNDFLKNTILD